MKSRLSIVHLNTERTWRGGERQTLWLAREMKHRGHESVLACRPGGPLDQRAREDGVTVFPMRPLFEMDPLASAKLKWQLRKMKADILHAHTGHAVGLGALASRGTSARFVATRRVDFPLRDNFLTRWKYGRADRLAAISGRVKNVMAASGLPADKIAVIPSGIDPADHPSRDGRRRYREDRGFKNEDILIVHAGALVPHKDQATLLAAMAEIHKTLPEAKLLILGEGPLKPELVRRAAESGLAKAVFFLGQREDVLEYMAMADLFVFSSKEEGLGTALLDALFLGVPTAATSAGGIPDIYGSAGAPELTPPGDGRALAANMLKVLQDPDESRARVDRGLILAGRFSVTAMADRYEELYKSLC